MGSNSAIEWTDHTFNPWWGCQRVSPGCTGCYAEALAKRFGHNVWGPTGHSPRRLFDDAHWAEPLKWNRLAEAEGTRRRVFCASMADVFEDDRFLDDQRSRLWELIERTPCLDWLLLTKRPELMTTLTPDAWRSRWPDNAWAMTSVESQEWADRRIPELLQVPARVRGLSCEPLLGALDLTAIRCPNECEPPHYCNICYPDGRAATGTFDAISDGAISWVIAGGESGPKAREPNPDWFRSLRDQCQAAGVAFFFKQWGEFSPGIEHATDARVVNGAIEYSVTRVGKSRAGRLLDGRTWDEFPTIYQEA